MILYFNSGSFTPGELAGLANCALVVLVLSLFLYGMYRSTPGPGMLRPFHPVLFPAPLTSFPSLTPSHAFSPSIY